MNNLPGDHGKYSERKKTLVLGGTGFVGRKLAASLVASSDGPVTYLVHRRRPEWLSGSPVEVIELSFEDLDGLHKIFGECQLLINMLRPDGTEWCLDLIRNILPVATSAGLTRIIHLSSIDVYGHSASTLLDEKSETSPSSDYAREHLKLEQAVLEAMSQATILRLGAVFGDGGSNVVSFCQEVQSASYWLLFLRRMLYGSRRMHLISLDAVCSIVCQLARRSGMLGQRIILVTDDDDERNNFAFLQDELVKAFGRSSLKATPSFPMPVLEFLLQLRGKEKELPKRRFSSEALQRMQLRRPDFGETLRAYVELLSRKPS